MPGARNEKSVHTSRRKPLVTERNTHSPMDIDTDSPSSTKADVGPVTEWKRGGYSHELNWHLDSGVRRHGQGGVGSVRFSGWLSR